MCVDSANCRGTCSECEHDREKKMKTYTVCVYYWPSSPGERELWLGYLRFEGESRSYVGAFTVCAETRSKAITKAINEAKRRKAAGENKP